ncbi:MAG: ArsR family transcriptional regulator [Gemmatimonadaceae bacterium]
MAWWQKHFRNTTRGRIVALLRRKEQSVEELAAALSLTDNAVRAQLATLQADGVAAAVSVRREGAVGKPAVLYGIAKSASDSLFSNAYGPVLAVVLSELARTMTPTQIRDVLRRAGRRLAPMPRSGHSLAALEARVRDGAAFLIALGGDVQVTKTAKGFEIQGFGCPIGQAVSACPDACAAIEALLSETTGANVREHCERTGSPHCRFVIPATG